MKTLARFAANERGVVALEFVLVFPFMMTLLFGIVDASLLLCDKAVITNAAREAARAGVVVRAGPSRLGYTEIQSVALNYANGNLVTSGTATTPTVFPQWNCQSPPDCRLTVTVSYTYNGLVLGSTLSSLTGPITVTAVAVMKYE